MAKLIWLLICCSGFWLLRAQEPSAPKIWVDTDNRLGRMFRDVDDFLAINYLLQQPNLDIQGISLVRAGKRHGLRITKKLLSFHHTELPVYQGALHRRDTGLNPAVSAMIQSLEKGKMRIVLLGPASNLAILLRLRADLADSIEQVIFCGGRSENTHFQPNQSKKFVFKDANFDYDPAAFQLVFDSKIPIVLAGYEAAYPLRISKSDLLPLRKSLYRFERANYRKIRRWAVLWAWFLDMKAFIPFDVATVAYLTDPQSCNCQQSYAQINRKPNDAKGSYSKADFKPYLEVSAVFEPRRTLVFCTGLNPEIKKNLLSQLSISAKKSKKAP